jgi:opacity protein-like surface antigen
MKKIAIFSALVALTSTSAIADDMYVKVSALGAMGHKLFDDNKNLYQDAANVSKDMNKFGEIYAGGQIAFGYKIMDNVRVELQGSYLNGPNFKYDFVKDGKDEKNSKNEYKVEATGPAVMLGGAVDFVSFGPASLYGTFGLGMSYMNVKMTGETQLKPEKDKTAPDAVKHDLEWEAKVRFAFNVGAGASFAVSDSVSIDAGYLLMSLGKPEKDDFKGKDKDKNDSNNTKDTTKDKKDADKLDWTGNNFMSHNVTVGVRFSF